MQVIGITGGVGSGKSRVTYFISELIGAPVFEADRVGHEVMEPGTPCHEAIVTEFGREILAEDGGIDRKKLGAVVFGDEERLAALNAIVHPAVYEATEAFLAEARGSGCAAVLMEAALPTEEFLSFCDEVWYVYAEHGVRVERLMADRGYTAERCEEIMSKQPPEDFYRDLSSVVIDNSFGWEETADEIRKLCERKFG